MTTRSTRDDLTKSPVSRPATGSGGRLTAFGKVRALGRRRVLLAALVVFSTTYVTWVSYGDPPNQRELEQLLTRGGPVDAELVEGTEGGGFVCNGFAPLNSQSGVVGEWGERFGNCPPGYAYYANQDPGGARPPGGAAIPVTGSCCRLPFDDILTDRHVYDVLERCPDDSIVTGTGVDKFGTCIEHCVVRCTYIDTSKYRLGEERSAYYWRIPAVGTTSGGGSAGTLSLTDIPLAIRIGVARYSHSRFDTDGCVGIPFGSLLVRKESRNCDGFFYRQLFFADGTPVPMYPRCDRISGLYEPNSKCETD